MYLPTVADRALGSAALRRRQRTARALARALGRVEVVGADHVPTRGPVVLVMNHRAFVDGPLIFGVVDRPVTCLVKVEAFTPRLGPLLLSAGQLPVRRGVVDAAPVRTCLRVLRGGGVVGIFPEGSRGDGLVRTSKPGAAYLAMRAGAVVVPVAFHGTELLGHGRHRPTVRIVFGPPVTVPAVDRHHRLNRRVVAAQSEQLRLVLADLAAASAPPQTSQDRSVAA